MEETIVRCSHHLVCQFPECEHFHKHYLFVDYNHNNEPEWSCEMADYCERVSRRVYCHERFTEDKVHVSWEL